MSKISCTKCGMKSGDDWSQCGGSCPMPMSPHYVGDESVREAIEEKTFESIRELVNSAKQEDKVRYRAARKELRRLKMYNPIARELISNALKWLK